METNPKPLYGNWAHGWALDLHTLSSQSEGGDSPCLRFATERTQIGEALFRLKYQGDRAQVGPIAATVVAFVRSRPELSGVAAVLAVPPSNTNRSFQPVEALVTAVGRDLGLPAPDNYLLKTKKTRPLKELGDKWQRREELDGAFGVTDQRFAGRHLLLVDDLFRSGETLKAVTAVLLFDGKVGDVSVLALTWTRKKR